MCFGRADFVLRFVEAFEDLGRCVTGVVYNPKERPTWPERERVMTSENQEAMVYAQVYAATFCAWLHASLTPQHCQFARSAARDAAKAAVEDFRAWRKENPLC